MSQSLPVLYIVIPCYNEQEVLPITASMFLQKIIDLVENKKISDSSRILFVNDGSRDSTWEIINKLSEEDLHYIGISQSRNRGHHISDSSITLKSISNQVKILRYRF